MSQHVRQAGPPGNPQPLRKGLTAEALVMETRAETLNNSEFTIHSLLDDIDHQMGSDCQRLTTFGQMTGQVVLMNSAS